MGPMRRDGEFVKSTSGQRLSTSRGYDVILRSTVLEIGTERCSTEQDPEDLRTSGQQPAPLILIRHERGLPILFVASLAATDPRNDISATYSVFGLP